MLFVDGNEAPVHRVGRANIIEQVGIVARAVKQQPEFFVTECMGLQPHLQELLEKRFIRSHIGVITNARPDHLDVMGPTTYEVAHSLSTTIPKNGHIFTAEDKYANVFKERAEQINSEFHALGNTDIDDADMRKFSFLEHKDNVSLALDVCEHFGVKRDDALKGMISGEPDPGALRRYEILHSDKRIEFISAFAANDPESYLVIWDMLKIHREPGKTVIVLINSRKDRIQRAEQLGEFIATHLDADYYIVAGEYTKPLVTKAISCGMPHNKIEDLGGRSQEAVFNSIVSLSTEKTLVYGIGNVVGFGEKIVRYFRERGKEVV
jgi:poly-gamma-glutamate synthase PgsB/CapB